MNTLSSLASSPPPLLASGSMVAVGGLAPTAVNPSGGVSGGVSGAAGPSRQASAWLHEGAQGPSEVLHVGPNSGPRPIDEIERDFVQALCQVDVDRRM
jgi:hypothetical protein